MTFMEAVKASSDRGVKIRLKGHTGFSAAWINGRLSWVHGDHGYSGEVLISWDVLGGEWEIVPTPPRQYDFAEAYKMMKGGKWMKLGETGTPQRFKDDYLIVFMSQLAYVYDEPCFSAKDIDGKWIEVQI